MPCEIFYTVKTFEKKTKDLNGLSEVCETADIRINFTPFPLNCRSSIIMRLVDVGF